MIAALAAPAALEAARRVLRARRRVVVVVDGRSGSGKTTFAEALARSSGAGVLRLDDVYPGWDGLQATAAALPGEVLAPWRAGRPGRMRRWDWGRDVPGDPLHVLPGDRLVVEGCGAASRSAAALADLVVWVELAEPVRERRALARDGAAFAPHWDRWAAQERRYIARERPDRSAGLVVDGRVLLSGSPSGPQYARSP